MFSCCIQVMLDGFQCRWTWWQLSGHLYWLLSKCTIIISITVVRNTATNQHTTDQLNATPTVLSFRPEITHLITDYFKLRSSPQRYMICAPATLYHGILYTRVRASWIEFINCATRCDLFSLLYFCRQL